MGNSLVETPFGICPTVTPQRTPFDGVDVMGSDYHLGTSFLFELSFVRVFIAVHLQASYRESSHSKGQLHQDALASVVCGRCIAQFFISQRLVQDFAHAPRGM